MRYVPNLIPTDAKVLPDYFKGDIYEPIKKNLLFEILSYIVAVAFFLFSIANLKHPLLALLLAVIGFIILPQGHHWLEKSFRFRLTVKIKSILCAILFIAAIPLLIQYKETDSKEAKKQQAEQEQLQQQKIEADKKEQQRKDSLDFYIQESVALTKAGKIEDALKKLDNASLFVSAETDKDSISKERTTISAIKTFALVKAGKYQSAIPELTNLISQDANNGDLLYNRAVCYNSIGKTQEAVDDLRSAIALDNPNAERLFNQINPIRKKIVDYVTLCCDGTTSYTNGRGACSHHRGVCGTKAIYAIDRKYGAKDTHEQDSLTSVNANTY